MRKDITGRKGGRKEEGGEGRWTRRTDPSLSTRPTREEITDPPREYVPGLPFIVPGYQHRSAREERKEAVGIQGGSEAREGGRTRLKAKELQGRV
jgi:hypothetical protein